MRIITLFLEDMIYRVKDDDKDGIPNNLEKILNNIVMTKTYYKPDKCFTTNRSCKYSKVKTIVALQDNHLVDEYIRENPIPLSEASMDTWWDNFKTLINKENKKEGSFRWAIDQWFKNKDNFNPNGIYGKYGKISEWIVSNVTNMFAMFDKEIINNNNGFSEDISAWDLSNVNPTKTIFPLKNNQPIDNYITANPLLSTGQSVAWWNVFKNTLNTENSKVGTFRWAIDQWFTNKDNFEFNGIYGKYGKISEWIVTNITNMTAVFDNDITSGANTFNENIGNWDVSNVTHMAYMFHKADKFNQNIGKWDVGQVIEMQSMFNDTDNFDNDGSDSINDWNVANVLNMGEMFYDALSFNRLIDKWNVSKVQNMSRMFARTRLYNKPLAGWERETSSLSRVKSMASMFSDSCEFDQNISNWKVSNVTNMSSMFEGACKYNQPLNSWDVSKVTDMEKMFKGAKDFNQDISNWDVSGVTTMEEMFRRAEDFDKSLKAWGEHLKTTLVTTRMFLNATAMKAKYNTLPDTPATIQATWEGYF